MVRLECALVPVSESCGESAEREGSFAGELARGELIRGRLGPIARQATFQVPSGQGEDDEPK
jgi:hypothetical protein